MLYSSNIYKFHQVNFNEDTLLIDNNEKIAKKIESLEPQMLKRAVGDSDEEPVDGFLSGLDAEQVDALLSGLPEDNIPAGGEDSLENGSTGQSQDASQSAGEALALVSAQGQEIIAEAKEEAEKIKEDALRDAQAEIEMLRQSAYEEAKGEGYEAGYKEAIKQVEQQKMQLLEERRQLEEEYQELADNLEPKFVEALTDIYEKVFQVDLQKEHDILMHLIASTMHKMEGSSNYLIHVSKEDYSYVNSKKEELIAASVSANASIELVEDITLGPNDCIIETDGGIFDCGLGTQLEELSQKLRLLSYRVD
ncbi:hypothetical protein D3Z45_14365 [Lachnospiraceae bacterium]|nr:hypothetical protein [Lachnospiraceae bacterium]